MKTRISWLPKVLKLLLDEFVGRTPSERSSCPKNWHGPVDGETYYRSGRRLTLLGSSSRMGLFWSPLHGEQV
jgi:hypothetical protein